MEISNHFDHPSHGARQSQTDTVVAEFEKHVFDSLKHPYDKARIRGKGAISLHLGAVKGEMFKII